MPAVDMDTVACPSVGIMQLELALPQPCPHSHVYDCCRVTVTPTPQGCFHGLSFEVLPPWALVLLPAAESAGT